MKQMLKNLLLLVCAGGLLASAVLFLSKDDPIRVNLPSLSLEEIQAHEEAQQKAAQDYAARAAARRLVRCESDDDCVIVDSDPCGCIVGPQGVTAINVNYVLDFDKKHGQGAKACPDQEPSQERECSPSAHAVCREQVCKISY